MAVELSRTLEALKTERDTVSALLQTRRELITSVSHELRTPIATLHTYLEATLGGLEEIPPVTLRHDLNVMAHEVIQLSGLIDDLFSLSRVEVGKLTLRLVPTDITPLIRGIVDTAAPLAWQNGRIQVIAELPDASLFVLADAGRVEQILWNLLHNSLRYTPPGGIVVLAARLDDRDPRDVCIEVRDTGSGIDPVDLPYIWDRFYQGGNPQSPEQSAHTTGVGLALVKDLTEAMQGKVNVISTLQQGSCFSIRLPRA
jgi:signal transduction histidine kinase